MFRRIGSFSDHDWSTLIEVVTMTLCCNWFISSCWAVRSSLPAQCSLHNSETRFLKMSLGQCLAENKFWPTPELVQKLLQVLDLGSTKELAEVHQLTRDILGGAFFWKKLIRKTFPEINIDFDHKRYPKEDDPPLASMHCSDRSVQESRFASPRT